MTEMIVAILFYLNLLVPNQEYTYTEVNGIYQDNMQAVSAVYYHETEGQVALQQFQSSSHYSTTMDWVDDWPDTLPPPDREGKPSGPGK